MIILDILVVGVAGAISMDIGQQLMKLVLKWPITNWAMIGRWAGYLTKGKLVHQDIGAETPIEHELALGWVVHYIVSISYGAIYLFLARVVFDIDLGFVPAIVFALAIVLITWFVIQPMLGAGTAGANTPNPTVTRLHDLASHTFYGIGLGIGGLLI